jgi:hypothetical protein
MLGLDETIVNNKFTTGLDNYIIHIDHAVITNTLANTSFNICLESMGATVDGVFRKYTDYVFFIQNNLMQHSGLCINFNNLVMNSRRVRLESSAGEITRAVIVDNVLIQLADGEVYDFGPNAPPDPIDLIIPRINTNRYVDESSLREISRNGQNVHNSTVVYKFKILYEKILKQLRESISIYDIDNFSIDSAYTNLISNSGLNSGLNSILNSFLFYKQTKLKTLMNVLEYSKKQNGFIYNLNDTEGNILKHIILYINNCVDQNYKADTFKLLADNMIDCLENDVIVCLTGRITRMLNSIEHLVSENDGEIKKNISENIDDIRQEMLAKAMTMFNNKVLLNEIKEALYLDYPKVDKSCLNTEIDSWNLEDLY